MRVVYKRELQLYMSYEDIEYSKWGGDRRDRRILTSVQLRLVLGNVQQHPDGMCTLRGIGLLGGPWYGDIGGDDLCLVVQRRIRAAVSTVQSHSYWWWAALFEATSVLSQPYGGEQASRDPVVCQCRMVTAQDVVAGTATAQLCAAYRTACVEHIGNPWELARRAQ